MATFDVRPLLATTLEIANVRAHVARGRLLSLARAIVEVQANKLVLFRLLKCSLVASFAAILSLSCHFPQIASWCPTESLEAAAVC